MTNKNNSSKSKNFLVQGSILAIAGIIVRLIGLLYRVPLTNIIGEEGIGVYSTAYSIYNILLLISSYTLPLALSRLIAARLSVKQYYNSYRIFIAACIFALISGGLMGIICYFGADLFSSMMNMPQASFAIKTLAPTIFIMAFLGTLRGYFQGHHTMVPTAISQIIEQIINAAVSLLAGYLLFKAGTSVDIASGTDHYYSAAYGAAGGTIGTGAGALSALIFTGVLFFSFRPIAKAKARRDSTGEKDNYPHLLKVLIMTIFPVLMSTTIYQVSTVIDQALYAQYLKSDYAGIWGAFNGKYMLLVHVPTAIATSLGSAVIPTLAAAMQRGRTTEIVDKSGTAIRFNMVIAIPATIGLAVLARPIMDLLFRTDNSLAAAMMIYGSTAIFFTALSTTTNSILQGIGNIWIPVRNAVIALFLHVVILLILLYGFDLGIYGVILANIVFYIIMCVANNLCLRNRLNYRQEWKKTFVSPIISSVFMGLAAFFSYKLLFGIFKSNLVAVIISLLISVLIYAVLLILTKGVDEVDISRAPMGDRIIKLIRKLRLIRD